MKSITKYLFFLISIIILSNNFINATVNPSEILISKPGINWEYLHYLDYYNFFDSSQVTCQIGEFSVIKNGNITRVIFKNLDSIDEGYFIQGDSNQGVDNKLTDYSRTKDFSYDSGSVLKIFRKLGAYVPCGYNLPSDSVIAGMSWQQKAFLVGINRIQDDTEWIIELIRTSDNALLATLDSIGINRNSTQHFALPHGTNPMTMNVTRILPDAFAGETVYLRVKVKRNGSTQYGMNFGFKQSAIAFSNQYEWGENNELYFKYLSEADYDTIYNYQFNLIKNYCDSIVSLNGYFPMDWNIIKQLSLTDSSKLMSFNERYFDSLSDEEGRKYFQEKTPNYRRPLLDSKDNNSKQYVKIALASNPKNDSELLKINITAYTPLNSCTISIFSIEGKLIFRESGLNFPLGKSEKLINTILSPGTYIITLTYSNGAVLDKIKILKQ